MPDNETIIRELYTFAEGSRMDMERFVAGFADNGYITDIPTGATLRGKAIGDYIGAFSKAFPDVHRELFKLYAAGDAVVVEMAIRGTHQGKLTLSPRDTGTDRTRDRRAMLRRLPRREQQGCLFPYLRHAGYGAITA